MWRLPADLGQQDLASVSARIHNSAPQFADLLPQLGTVLSLPHVDQEISEQRHLGVDLHDQLQQNKYLQYYRQLENRYITNSMAYETHRFNAAFTRALQQSLS